MPAAKPSLAPCRISFSETSLETSAPIEEAKSKPMLTVATMFAVAPAPLVILSSIEAPSLSVAANALMAPCAWKNMIPEPRAVDARFPVNATRPFR
ncbi:hypothetical protein WJ977_26565 [Achromobacter xylosoxidans]